MIYAYAVAQTAELPAGTKGLGRAAVRSLEAGGLVGIYSRHRTLRPRPSPETMWAHQRVVEAVARRTTTLPMRFGTMLDDERGLADALAERRAELAARLARVQGCVELGLRIVADRSGPRPAGGREYVLALVEERRRGERLVLELHEPLAAVARESRLRESPGLLSAAYLVERGDVDAFRARVEELTAAETGVRVVCTGPWPPYSFAMEDDEDRG